MAGARAEYGLKAWNSRFSRVIWYKRKKALPRQGRGKRFSWCHLVLRRTEEFSTRRTQREREELLSSLCGCKRRERILLAAASSRALTGAPRAALCVAVHAAGYRVTSANHYLGTLAPQGAPSLWGGFRVLIPVIAIFRGQYIPCAWRCQAHGDGGYPVRSSAS